VRWSTPRTRAVSRTVTVARSEARSSSRFVIGPMPYIPPGRVVGRACCRAVRPSMAHETAHGPGMGTAEPLGTVGIPPFRSVRKGGVEPPRPFGHTDLNRARLPIPPLARGAHPAGLPAPLEQGRG